MKRACRDCEWGVYYPEATYEQTIWEDYREHWYSLWKNGRRKTGETHSVTVPDFVQCRRFWPELLYINGEELRPDWFCRKFEQRTP